MSEESIHDIIREMMNCTAVKSKVPHSTVEDTLNPPIIRFDLEQRAIVRDFAYRIAAAEERSKTPEPEKSPGNAAAMREALEEQSRYWWSHIRNYFENEMLKRTDAALSAPARNCDIGTAEEQAERHGRFCAAHYKADAVDAQCFGCPASDKKETDCEFVWGQLPFAPAEGGPHA